MRDFVSIIIPCFNSLPYLEETLGSLYSQEHDNFEIILVDDHSNSDTLDFLNNQTDPRFTWYANPSKGACAARNYGFSLSKGDYIQYLDADDILSENKLAEQVSLLKENPNCVAVCSTAHFYSEKNENIINDQEFLFDINQPEKFLLNLWGADGKRNNMIQTNAWLTPRSIIDKVGPWDESLTKDQDGEFFARVVMKSSGICYAQNALNYYRKFVGGTNISAGKKRHHFESQIKALESKRTQLKEFASTQEYKNAFAIQYKTIGVDAWPEYKDLHEITFIELEKLGGTNFMPIIGGRLIQTLAKVFGWKFAKTFKKRLNALLGR